MGSVVCKFGGSSVACSERIQQLEKIIALDSRRRFIVVSAPGKRSSDDRKITDLLLLCYDLAAQGLDISEPYTIIKKRFLGIAGELRVSTDVPKLLDEIHGQIKDGASKEFVASRGEFLCAQIVADYLGATFIEASEVIRFSKSGTYKTETYGLLAERVQEPGLYVIPGFYGATEDGIIKTFPRSGSDITGAVVARAVDAEVYENWTDVSGFLMANPDIVDNPRPLRQITYRELRELAYMGAEVFHEDAVLPVYKTEIPINIRNSYDPDDLGTLISKERPITDDTVVGVAGKPGFSLVFIRKFLMNREVGFGRRVLEILDLHNISYEHSPSGIDSMSIIISDEQLGDQADTIVDEIQHLLNPDDVEIQSGFALVCAVGEGMAYRPGIAAKLFRALADAEVNVRTIDQGSSEINITVGVEAKDYERAVQAVYEAFC